jgi:hypothetical protein
VKHLLNAPLLSGLLTLPKNIRLDRKVLPATNTLAYYEHSYITDVKCFITLAPDISVFLSLIYATISGFSNDFD